MSPRAAWRLEGLGFSEVYDYVAGKADWSAYGLPLEGEGSGATVVGQVARRDVPTCSPEETVGEARERLTGWDRCAVVNSEGVVLGVLRAEGMTVDPETPAEQAMRPGPTTIRPDVPAGRMVERMRARGTALVLVTTPDGRLVGALRREDAEPHDGGGSA